MKSENLKRYRVTQSLRFPSNIMKGLFFAGLVLLPLCILLIALSFFVGALASLRGLAIIIAVLAVIWLFSSKFISESYFGMANVSFTAEKLIFRTGGDNNKEYSLAWEQAKCCGLIKTRWAWWCYVSDHELSERERKEFPEFTEKGVFYFSYADNTWEEFMNFVPERFRSGLENEKERMLSKKEK